MKHTTLKLIAAVALVAACVVAQAAGVDLMTIVSPEAAMGLTALGGALSTNFVQEGETLNLAPGSAVAPGAGHLFGAGLFGVALTTAETGVPSSFLTEGVVEIGKTSALAIAVGDRLFWDATNKVVNKTSLAQQCVGVAVAVAGNPSATVKMKLGQYLPVAV